MKKKIEQILSNYFEAYNFVSVEHYKQEKAQNQTIDFDFLNEFKTIITVGIPYPSKETQYKGKGYGILSRYAYNTDYHIVMRNLLNKCETKLGALGFKTKAAVDTSLIDERFASYLAHLGYIGKNQFLIHKKYGSYMYLGTILIDTEISTNKTPYDICDDCTLCIEACPSGALDDGFDEQKCISYLTQAKEPLNETEIGLIKTMIYGCDICQKVCPKNTRVDVHTYEEFEPSGIENIHLETLLKMTNKDYMRIYKNNASSWRGATVIKRNALCLIANQNLTEYIELIQESIIKYHDVLWYNETAKNVLKILNRE
ncbi:MAG: tRNA epoxyqueuosine(34) reductase QueG [Candidatus Izimaplasma sp.]|nr:tRNA epoxyqueuosine(34) reductase QueG [Candidatus Izimaplasma bacterium]